MGGVSGPFPPPRKLSSQASPAWPAFLVYLAPRPTPGPSVEKHPLTAGPGGRDGLLPTGLTLAARGLGACPGGRLCWPAVRLCRRALGGRLHLLAAPRLLGQEARALRPSCQLFSLCGDTARLWVTRPPPSG